MARDAGFNYKKAGVDRDLADESRRRIADIVRETFTDDVIQLPNGFAGLMALPDGGVDGPVLVAGADGVGTKLKLATALDRYDTIGIDLVAMNVNDVLVHGASPLFFLDYIAMGGLGADQIADLVAGMAEGCKEARVALLGGETAQMPGLYEEDEFDLAGFCVGVTDRDRIIDGKGVQSGNVLLGLTSSGFHANGFSLVRKVIEERELPLDKPLDGMSEPLGEVLLTPTRIYSEAMRFLLKAFVPNQDVLALAHITGGGLAGNLRRVLPEGCRLELRSGSWDVPEIFHRIQELGGISDEEMFRTFNLGIGFCVIVPEEIVDLVARVLAYVEGEVRVIGHVVDGEDGDVVLV